MYCGFDYGTSNCALGIMSNGEPRLAQLEGHHKYLPSAVYALSRDLITESVAKGLSDEQRAAYIASRNVVLSRAQRFRSEEGYESGDQVLFYGREAFEEYYQYQDEGYFVKSPKSFLGGVGLRVEHVRFFEDIVTVMMQNVKQRSEMSLGVELTQAVIGRPVNFQGIDAAESNAQALEILTASAQRAGFRDIEFQYEPIAAGIDFERNLTKDKTVLVVDIGGGTSDCAMVRMGPSYLNKSDRTNDFLAYTGERVGGNDLDIQLAGREIMPLFGMGAELKTGLPMPTQIYWNAVTTNDVVAQSVFNSMETKVQMEHLRMDMMAPELMDRFALLRELKQNFHVVKNAEEAKISLSDSLNCTVDLSYIESGLGVDIDRDQFALAVESPLQKMIRLMESAISESGERPDVIYITGGSAKSPVVQSAIRSKIGDIPVLDGDHFGSVASGLASWSERLFR
ncbi:molecular chaperone [Marinomonas piezotolerans]|uniref:Molecular chaperone n=1 Tax=Marinomonas piezotolerans TaxID=2213058 RepID=A0A370U5H8_9GAMM|nr:molecular chaperone [Marinomonas piezotolerans]RDL43013.1 molecular chaperone [Marinomonas piezotolerans]